MADMVRARWALVDFRRERGLTQQALATVLRVSRAGFSEMEGGKAHPKAAMLARFEEVFCVEAPPYFELSEREREGRTVQAGSIRRERPSRTDSVVATDPLKAVG